MNIRKIKLALTVGLLNTQGSSNLLNSVRDLMLGFKEVGAFLGLDLTSKSKLTPNNIRQTYALKFEHCTLKVDLVKNPRTKSQYVQSFQIR